MELASGQPTQRLESVTDVVVFPFARENSRTEVNSLQNSPGQLTAAQCGKSAASLASEEKMNVCKTRLHIAI